MSFEERTQDIKATFQKCLESPEPFANENEKQVCQRLVQDLAEDLIQYAANTSYAFWYLSREPDTCPSQDVQIQMAMREARRHLSWVAGDYDKALENLTESCKYRKDKNLDLLRTCFDIKAVVAEEHEKRSNELAELVRADMMKQYVVMRGYDRENRAVMIKYARTQQGTTEESYLLAQIYMAERSTAATEFRSLGKEERSVAVYDYTGSDSRNAPPIKVQISAATLLQKLYPERLQTLVMSEPPFWLRGVLSLLNQFLSVSITERIKHASGVDEKEKVFGTFMDAKNAPPMLLKNGRLDTPVSLGHFLEDVPFYALYDDVKCARPIEMEEKAMNEPIQVTEAPSLTQSLWNSMF